MLCELLASASLRALFAKQSFEIIEKDCFVADNMKNDNGSSQ